MKGLYKHTTKPITFTLIVDDFGICTTSRADLYHLHQALNAKYTTIINISGALYLDMTLMWDYDQGHVDVSMSGYIVRDITRFRVQLPTRPQHSPHA